MTGAGCVCWPHWNDGAGGVEAGDDGDERVSTVHRSRVLHSSKISLLAQFPAVRSTDPSFTASQLDTLCPQAFTSRPAHTSLHALRTYFILSLIWLIQLAIFFNSEVILVAMRQDPDVARHAATYLKVLSFGIPGYSAFECLRRWLQAQGLMVAPVLALLVAAPVNLLLNWLLVWGPVDWLRLGFVGSPLASALSMHIMVSVHQSSATESVIGAQLTSCHALQFIVSLVYAIVVAPRTAWGGFTWGKRHPTSASAPSSQGMIG